MASPLAERTDIVLADLAAYLQDLDRAKVVLVVATECKTTLPCCQQPLGLRNSQVSKLWAAAHWKEASCAAFWKDKHILCVRKYRKNSAYAKDEEVFALLGARYPDIANHFLHNFAKTASPNQQKRQPFGARRASSVTLNSVSTARSLATTKTPESVEVVEWQKKTVLTEEASPSQGRIVGVRPPLKARLSEPVVSSNASRPPARPSMVTRRQSGITLSKPVSTTSVDLKARIRPSASPSTAASTSPVVVSVQSKRRASAVDTTTAKPVSIVARRIASASASCIPTPTKRPVPVAARRVAATSPETPTARKSLEAQLVASPERPKGKISKDIAIQTEIVIETPHFAQDQDKLEIAGLARRIQDLELENATLNEQVEKLDWRCLAWEAEKGQLEGELTGKDAIIKDLLEQLRAARPTTVASQTGRSSLHIERKDTRTAEVAAASIPSAHKLQSMLYATPPPVRFQLDMLPVPSTPDCSETY